MTYKPLRWPDTSRPAPPRMSYVPGKKPGVPPVRQEVGGRMNSEERAQLALFARRAQDFIAAKTPKTLLDVQNHYDERPVDEGKPPILVARTITAPVDDELAAKLLRLRHLVLEKEPATYNRVRNAVSAVCHKAKASGVQAKLDRLKDIWKVADIRHMGSPVDGERLLNLWFNAEMFHGSPEQLPEWEDLHSKYGPHVRAWLMLTLALKQSAVIEFRDFLMDETDFFEPLEIRSDEAQDPQ